jgi:hypothetical protein
MGNAVYGVVCGYEPFLEKPVVPSQIGKNESLAYA